jgi:hypothetical protein
MDGFPRTVVGGVSVSRMIIGTNWFLGFSHTTRAKDAYIRDHMDRKKIAEIIGVFLDAGVDTLLGPPWLPVLREGIEDARDRTGRDLTVIATPLFPVSPRTPVDGFDRGAVARILDDLVPYRATFCMPHQATTDAMVDRCTREVRQMAPLCGLIRERGLIPGLSTHMPETIVYADETDLDVETYISIYNAAGFLMQLEVDWIARIMNDAKKPVIAIKPFAAGRIPPFQGLTFVWNTIRPQDMVAVGTSSPREAAEVIEMSRRILERRHPAPAQLQETRSKASVRKTAPA